MPFGVVSGVGRGMGVLLLQTGLKRICRWFGSPFYGTANRSVIFQVLHLTGPPFSVAPTEQDPLLKTKILRVEERTLFSSLQFKLKETRQVM